MRGRIAMGSQTMPRARLSKNGRGMIAAATVIVSCVGVSIAQGEPIQFLHRGVASGALASIDGSASRITFGPSAFTIDAIADTDDRGVLASGGFDTVHTSVVITIDGLGTFDVLVPTRTYVVYDDSQGRVGFGMEGSTAPPDLFNGPLIEGLGSWDMTTSTIAATPGVGTVLQWDAVEVLTTGGRLLFDFSDSVDWNFQAIILPAPGALGSLACLGLFASRRRR